ncbi:hypothetical protein P7H16_21580 [Paenibacillus larvae]|nr:hypothetical protein [Paenibacillus larvae]MDT2248982.1 hypothetical protein [Paenibacillus larvae]
MDNERFEEDAGSRMGDKTGRRFKLICFSSDFLHQSVSIAWESVLYIQFIIVIWIFASIWYQLFKINKQDVQVGVEKEWKKKHVALSSVFGLAWGNFKSQLAYTGYIVLSLAASLGTILFLLNMLFGTRKNVQTTF